MSQHRQALERRLSEMSGRIDWPAADLAGSVRAEIERTPAPRRRPRLVPAAVTLVAVLVLTMATAPGREAVAGLLGVAGIEIGWGSLPPTSPGAGLELGEPATLSEAVERVGFPLLVPSQPGVPDGVFVSDDPAGGRVDTVWIAGADLPDAGVGGIGLLHTQFRVELDRGLLGKRIGPGTAIRSTVVRGRPAYWIEGAPHVLSFLDPDGAVREETTRLAGNVLVWEEGGVTHRIESALGLDAARAVAESLEPYDG